MIKAVEKLKNFGVCVGGGVGVGVGGISLKTLLLVCFFLTLALSGQTL